MADYTGSMEEIEYLHSGLEWGLNEKKMYKKNNCCFVTRGVLGNQNDNF